MKKRQIFIKYLCFFAGMAILAFGLYNVHARTGISEGGVIGLILLINHWCHISPTYSSFVIDTLSFILASFVLGRRFLKDTIIATALFSIWYFIFEHTGYMFPDLSGHPMIAAVTGALFVGIGTGLIVIYGTACGADDALVLVMNKKFRTPVSAVYFVSDFVVLTASLSYIPVVKIIFSLISVIISSFIIEMMTRLIKPELYEKIEEK